MPSFGNKGFGRATRLSRQECGNDHGDRASSTSIGEVVLAAPLEFLSLSVGGLVLARSLDFDCSFVALCFFVCHLEWVVVVVIIIVVSIFLVVVTEGVCSLCFHRPSCGCSFLFSSSVVWVDGIIVIVEVVLCGSV